MWISCSTDLDIIQPFLLNWRRNCCNNCCGLVMVVKFVSDNNNRPLKELKWCSGPNHVHEKIIAMKIGRRNDVITCFVPMYIIHYSIEKLIKKESTFHPSNRFLFLFSIRHSKHFVKFVLLQSSNAFLIKKFGFLQSNDSYIRINM